MIQTVVGSHKLRSATRGDGCFLRCKKQIAVNPFSQHLNKVAEKCGCIFLEVQCKNKHYHTRSTETRSRETASIGMCGAQGFQKVPEAPAMPG